MGGSQIKVLRGFNRTVTERVGALQDAYLARARPLGASRVLWEIGVDGTSDARALRSRLGLDSGYLSRLLHSLENEGLIVIKPSERDTRVRAVTLTKQGVQERDLLDECSDELAASLLEPLTVAQRERLVDAAQTVERLLTVGLIQIAGEPPDTEDARFCLDAYFAELDHRFEAGFDPAISISADADELTEPAGLLLVARLRQQPIGCGALKFQASGRAEIKRMWVDESARGLGLGRRLLTSLEDAAAERGAGIVRLETNRALDEAISLYRSCGYREVPAFNSEPFAHHWFEKDL